MTGARFLVAAVMLVLAVVVAGVLALLGVEAGLRWLLDWQEPAAW